MSNFQSIDEFINRVRFESKSVFKSGRWVDFFILLADRVEMFSAHAVAMTVSVVSTDGRFKDSTL